MQIVRQPISLQALTEMCRKRFGNLVKAVVDLDRQIMAIDAEMHADEEKELINDGSKQQGLWGINLYPEKFGSPEFIEFDSMINLRPSQNNKTRSIDDEQTKARIRELVGKLVIK